MKLDRQDVLAALRGFYRKAVADALAGIKSNRERAVSRTEDQIKRCERDLKALRAELVRVKAHVKKPILTPEDNGFDMYAHDEQNYWRHALSLHRRISVLEMSTDKEVELPKSMFADFLDLMGW